MELDELFPEQVNPSAPIVGGAAEPAALLTRGGHNFVYQRSCECCGHWFLSMNFPLEVCLDYVGRTIKAYDLTGRYPAFAQMIIPAIPYRREMYTCWFLENFARAWEYVAVNGGTYTVPYKDMPGHEPGQVTGPT